MSDFTQQQVIDYLMGESGTFSERKAARMAANLIEEQQAEINELYRALRGLLKAHRHVYGLDGAWDSEVKAAQAALAKADGE